MTDRVGGRQPGLVGYPGDEVFCLAIIEPFRVDAHGHHRGGLDERGDLFVEAGGPGR